MAFPKAEVSGGKAGYSHLNCGYSLSWLPFGLLSKFIYLHVTHTYACAPGQAPGLTSCPQFREQLQWKGGRAVLRQGSCLPMCVLSWRGLWLDCEQLWVGIGQVLLNQLVWNTVLMASQSL